MYLTIRFGHVGTLYRMVYSYSQPSSQAKDTKVVPESRTMPPPPPGQLPPTISPLDPDPDPNQNLTLTRLTQTLPDPNPKPDPNPNPNPLWVGENCRGATVRRGRGIVLIC